MSSKSRAKLNLMLEGSLDRAIKRAQIRLLFLICAIFITYSAIAYKTFKLTFFYEPEEIKKLSALKSNLNKLQSDETDSKEEFRKSIYDRNGILISSNLITSSLYVNPKIMMEPQQAVKQLSKILPELNQKELLEKFNDKGKSFIWVKRNLHPKQKYEINALGIPGLMFEDEEKRIYPHGNLFAHVIGMVGQDERGLSGLEKYLDNLDQYNFDNVLNGDNITTTLDIRVQNVLKNEMQKTLEMHKAVGASGVVLDVNTGEILAMVSLPDYDPNLPKNLRQSTLFNNVTQGNFELGSVFKPFTFATAFENGKINEKEVFDATNPIKIGRFTISDFHPQRRPLTVPEVLMHSSNIGTSRIALEVGVEKMQEYFKKLGFYNKLEVEVNEKSIPTTPKKWSEITLVTASYGHGLAVSPLHVAAAMASIVNGGLYYQPTLIKRDNDQKLTQPNRIFSKKTSDRMKDLLRLVVVGGSGKKANVDGYLVGGKTGTAEKISSHGKYMEGRVVATFVGVFPMNNPKYLVLESFDDPKPIPETHGFVTAGWVAAPSVANVITEIAPMLKVRPQKDNSSEILNKFNIAITE